jgi:16S rRNA (cytidine1402-2'-O)-methyltransferase
MNDWQNQNTRYGTLYICATPIGNLEDITLRVLRILQEVDFIAAEDTRVTRKLLSHFKISSRITSLYEHNEATKSKEIIESIKAGKSVALVSDAGTPGISDPGQRLIKHCIEQRIPIEPLPGPSSLITALVVSGLPTERFVFEGFLPRKKGERAKLLTQLLSLNRTVIILESPKRILSTLKEIAGIDSGIEVVIARELTKKFEEVLRGTATVLCDVLAERVVKGEVVLLVGPLSESRTDSANITDEFLLTEVQKRVDEGIGKKDAIRAVAKYHNIEKRRVYNTTIKKNT